MSSDSKFFIYIAIGAALVLGVIIYFSSHSSSQTTDVTTEGQKLGPDSAKVKIVEFSDFQCPACATAAVDFHKVQVNNAQDVQIIYRFFPLPMHSNGQISAQAGAAAANQGKFWEMDELLFAKQTEWENMTDPTNYFVSQAKDLGMDGTKFKQDLTSQAVIDLVKKDTDYGNSIGVNETPTFYVNGKQVVGSQTLEAWQKLINDAKAK